MNEYRLPRSILLLLRNSWGEIEWFLPILYRLKAEEPRARLYTVFTCDRFYDERRFFPALYALLRQVSDRIFRPLETLGVDTDWAWPEIAECQRIVERPHRPNASLATVVAQTNAAIAEAQQLRQTGQIGAEEYEGYVQQLQPMCDRLRHLLAKDREDRASQIERAYCDAILDRELAGEPFDLILRDDGRAFEFHRLVEDRLRHVPVVRGAHGFDLTNREPHDVHEGFLKEFSGMRHLLGRAESWLTCSHNLAEVRRVYWNDRRSAVIGFPRLDRAWVDTVLRASAEEIAAMHVPQTGRRILWISRQMSECSFDAPTWKRVVESTLQVFRDRPGTHVIVKPHPRQILEDLLRALEILPRDRWTLWLGSTMSAASQADIVVSVWSSAILDALAVGKPLIEYFEYTEERMNQARAPEGGFTGGWRSHNLAVPADTPADVHRLLDLFESDPDHPLWRRQREAYAALHPPDADHTGAAVHEIARVVGAWPDSPWNSEALARSTPPRSALGVRGA